MRKSIIAIAVAMAAGLGLASSGFAADKEITIGQFGNPTPFQVQVAKGAFSKATGWKINWRKFNSGAEVIAAMASGDVKLSELGSSPLAIAASQGVDLQLFLISEGIGQAESLIVRNDAKIDSPKDLKGKRLAVPVGSTAHFSLMGALSHWGYGPSDVQVISMPPDQIAAAWQQGAIDGAFIWEPVQSEALKTGKRLVDAGTVAGWGFPTFDGWVVNATFAKESPEFLTAFTRVMAAGNQAYLSDPAAWTATSENVGIIAKQTGAAPDQVPAILTGFTFLTLEQQASPSWLGGTAAKAMKETAEFLKKAGRIEAALPDYSKFVNVGPINSAMK